MHAFSTLPGFYSVTRHREGVQGVQKILHTVWAKICRISSIKIFKKASFLEAHCVTTSTSFWNELLECKITTKKPDACFATKHFVLLQLSWRDQSYEHRLPFSNVTTPLLLRAQSIWKWERTLGPQNQTRGTSLLLNPESNKWCFVDFFRHMLFWRPQTLKNILCYL